MMKYILSIAFILLLIDTTTVKAQDRMEQLTGEIERLVDKRDYHGAKAKIEQFYRSLPGNPTELQMVEKYEVDKINRRVNEYINREDRVYQEVVNTKSLSKAQYYLNNYPYGKYRSRVKGLLSEALEEDTWQKAKKANTTAAYYDYVDEYPNGKYKDQAMSTIKRWDKAAYNKAIEKGTESALNYYLRKYPRGEYRSEIRAAIAEVREKEKLQKEIDMYEKAVRTNLITDYEAYISRYPNGRYAETVNRIIENSYFKFATDDFKAKEWYNAKTNYNKYLAKYPTGRHAAEARSQLGKIERKLRQRGASYAMYTYDFESPVGISFGGLKLNNLGTYINIKLHPDIFTGMDVLYEIDEYGESDSPWDYLEYTGEYKEPNISGSFGLTYKLVYPLWIYGGAAVGYFPQYIEMDVYSEDYNGDLEYIETEFYKNSAESSVDFMPEGGLMLKVGRAFVLKYGIQLHHGMNHQFGLGIQI